MKVFHNGVTEPKGFAACGKYTGLKNKRKDLAIIYTEKDAVMAGVFTTNKIKAASIQRNMVLNEKGGKFNAVVINSGNANACTGEKGLEDNFLMAKTLADSLKIDPDKVITASTGVIGVPLPMDLISEGIKNSVKYLTCERQGGLEAAAAIMTTDTVPKEVSVNFKLGKNDICIGAMAKGSGMIHPNMATMLSFITTDINITENLLKKALKETVEDTYNMISVDGDTSTNDMVCILANGMAGNSLIDTENDDYKKFREALYVVNEELAKMIVKDGEGATKFLEVSVDGASTKESAKKMCKSIVNSNLVKTAFFGEDANWGRIVCAMGYSGAEFSPETIDLEIRSRYGSIKLMKAGTPLDFKEEIANEVLKGYSIEILITLKDGTASAKCWGCDMSYEYVRINGDYRT